MSGKRALSSGKLGPISRILPPVTDAGRHSLETEALTIAACIRRGEIGRDTLAFMVAADHPTWRRVNVILACQDAHAEATRRCVAAIGEVV